MSTEQWDDFEIFLDDVIGKGGMGTVYRGRQVSLDRPVAIKVLNEELLEDEQFIQRFRREGMVMGKLSNPHIVQVLGAGEQGGQYYIAMEYLEGTTLEELLKKDEQFTYRQIMDVGLGVAKAMDTAWEHDIIHRDIKPDNIFLEKDEHVKVMDYGLARTEETGLTKAGTAMGTYQYMSIEQMEGEEVDVRTDIYSLGLVLYQMVTGILPGSGKTATEIYKNRTENEPLPPRKMDSDIPRGFEELIMDCLKREPSLRPSAPAEVVSRLEQVLHNDHEQLDRAVDMDTVVNHESMESGSSTLENITTQIRQRIPTTVSGSVLLTVAIAILLGVGVLTWYPPANIRMPFGSSPSGETSQKHSELSFPSKSLEENVSIARAALVKNNFEEAERILRNALEHAQNHNSDRVSDIKSLLKKTRYNNVREKALREEEQENWSKARSLWKKAQEFRKTQESEQKLNELKRRITHRVLSFPSRSLEGNIELAREARVKGNLQDAEEILQNALKFAKEANPSQTERIKTGLDRVRYQVHRQKAVESEQDGEVKEALSNWQKASEHRATEESAGRIKQLKAQLAEQQWEHAAEQLDWEQLLAAAETLTSLYPDRDEYETRRQLVINVRKALQAKENKQWTTSLSLLQKWVDVQGIDERLLSRVLEMKQAVQQSLNSDIQELANRAEGAFSRHDWSAYLQLSKELSDLKGELDQTRKKKRQLARWGTQTPDGMVFFPGTRYLGDTVPREIQGVRAFYIDRTEVTVGEYSAFLEEVKTNKYRCPVDELQFSSDTKKQLQTKDHTPLLWDARQVERPKHPVTGVDWYDAYCFSRWSKKRLPTASEWKAAALYDASSNTYQLYPWGNKYDAQLLVRDRIASVRTLPERGASPSGAVGMAGNAGEWTRSVKGSNGQLGQVMDNVRFIVQGATFEEDRTASDRTASGAGHTPLYRSISTGFRCVKYPSQD